MIFSVFMLRVIDVIFFVSVMLSGASLLIFIFSGFLLVKKMKKKMPLVLEGLGNPVGVTTLLMRNTSLYESFLKPRKHRSEVSVEIKKLGDIAVFSKYSFHFFSALCLLCLILIVLIK